MTSPPPPSLSAGATGRECHAVVCTYMGKDYRKWYFLGISVSTLDCMNALKEAKQGGYESMHFRLGTPLFDGGALSFGSGGLFTARWQDTADMGLAYEISVVIIGFDFDFFGPAQEEDSNKFLRIVFRPVWRKLMVLPFRPPGYRNMTRLTLNCLYEHAETLKETIMEYNEQARMGHPALWGMTPFRVCTPFNIDEVYSAVFKASR